jgi:benzoyl-CoA reductase/2-hydroxyglutaryl-CoA dehydratase subunit BcrC/BadD/HgdB
LEHRLESLIRLSSESNRDKFPLQWKKDGKKVVGVLCSYVPEEIIHAAGMLPWRIMGTQSADTSHAELYRPPQTCLYCNHVLESLLTGRYDFLDAVVATSWDQDLVRLWDVWKYLGKTPATYIIHLPLSNTDTHRKQFEREIAKFFRFMVDLAGEEISAEVLSHSIELFNKSRELLRAVYDLRKRGKPPLSGSEVLGLTTASLLMPREKIVEELEALLPYLEGRENSLETDSPRLLVSSDRLDNPEYLKVVEETGCIVAMDDLDTGSRCFWNLTEECGADSTEEMLNALARRYHSQPASPSMTDWAEQADQVERWVKEFDIQGVLELPQMYSPSRQMRAPYFKRRLTSMGIPVVSFEREYHLSNVGQLKTRVGAFVEMLSQDS